MATWTIDSIPAQASKTIIITGANSGIGWEAAAVLASKGASVVLACRNLSKAEDALARIRSAYPSANVKVMRLDLASLASIRAFASEFKATHAAEGAWPTLRAATDPEAKGADYYGPSGFMEMGGAPVKVGRTRAAKDPEVAKKLWERSAELTATSFAPLA